MGGSSTAFWLVLPSVRDCSWFPPHAGWVLAFVRHCQSKATPGRRNRVCSNNIATAKRRCNTKKIIAGIVEARKAFEKEKNHTVGRPRESTNSFLQCCPAGIKISRVAFSSLLAPSRGVSLVQSSLSASRLQFSFSFIQGPASTVFHSPLPPSPPSLHLSTLSNILRRVNHGAQDVGPSPSTPNCVVPAPVQREGSSSFCLATIPHHSDTTTADSADSYSPAANCRAAGVPTWICRCCCSCTEAEIQSRALAVAVDLWKRPGRRWHACVHGLRSTTST